MGVRRANSYTKPDRTMMPEMDIGSMVWGGKGYLYFTVYDTLVLIFSYRMG